MSRPEIWIEHQVAVVETGQDTADVISAAEQGPPGGNGADGVNGEQGDPGPAGPNLISDATALDELTEAVADALFLLGSNAAGDSARKLAITSMLRSLLTAAFTPGRVLLTNTGPAVADNAGLAFDTATGKLKVRLPAGTASDEVHLYHDGANAWLENRDTAGNAHLYLWLGGGEFVALKRSAGLEVAPLGTARHLLQDSAHRMGSTVRQGWSSTTNPNSAPNDTETYRASAGVMGISVNAVAPADSALTSGSVAFYTDANGDLKIKLKDAGGTVRTGTVDLT